MTTKVYNPQNNLTVTIIPIWEDNDDEQTIQPGQSGTSATDICVSPGPNGKRDTNKSDSTDDVVSGENILVGQNLRCDTTANDVDLPTVQGFSAIDVQNYLNGVFKQCVTSFVVTDGTYSRVNYDLNRDGKLNRLTTQEKQAIIDGAKDTHYNFNIFVVGDIDDTVGFASSPGPYIYVKYNVQLHVIAHEMGHALGNLSNILLESPVQDDENLMSHTWLGERLRMGQWDMCNNN